MCGVAGIYAYGADAPPVDEHALLAVRDSMVARGPDDAGLWVSGDRRVGLAHRRLSIIDLSPAGAQPMMYGLGELRISFNGEIYNYEALRAELVAQGRQFRSHSDTEVLLHLYDRDGPDMVHALRGMYAFAIWDEAKRGLFLARDPFGIKPLYYADDGATVRVASQVKALLAGGAVDRVEEPAGHIGFFLWGYVPEPYTLFRRVRALPAGSTLWIDRHGLREPVRFFSAAAELARAAEESTNEPADAVVDRLREALADSVRHHLVADVPVGVFLSSGLDSSTILGLAAEQASEPLCTVTLAFDEYTGTAMDEAPLAEETARVYGARHQTRSVRKADFAAEHDALVAAMDQPSIDGVNTYFVSKVTAGTGLKVAMSGLGGDELFGGYPSFGQIPKLVKTLGPLRPLRELGRGFRIVAAPVVRTFTSPKYASLFEYGTSYGDAYLLRRSLFMPWELPDVLDGEMVREGWGELDTLARVAGGPDRLGSERAKVSALEIDWYMRNQLLRDADWAGMAHSLEIRVPLIDIVLFRALAPMLCAVHPPAKRDMALTPRQPLPRAVLDRPKTGFVVPVREWLHGGGGGERGLRGWAKRVYSLCYAEA